MASGMPKWIQDLIDKGESVFSCLELWKEIKSSECEERVAERKMKKAEMDREIRLKELEVREKELERGPAQDRSNAVLKTKLPKFIEGQDPDVFLNSFEKLVTLHKIPKSDWAIRLVPLLCGKALEAYSRLSEEKCKSYNDVKTAILSRYELTAEAYRSKFRNSQQFKEKSFKEFSVRMKGFVGRWCAQEGIGNDFEKFLDLIVREQLTLSCSKELRMRIREQKVKNVQELVELADAFQQANKSVGGPRNSDHPISKFTGDQTKPRNEYNQTNGGHDTRTCYICHCVGHIASRCPLKKYPNENRGRGKVKFCVDVPNKRLVTSQSSEEFRNAAIVHLPGVEGVDVNGRFNKQGIDLVEGQIDGDIASVLRDTGSSTVFVHSKFIKPENLTKNWKEIYLADGTVRQCQEMWVNIETPYITGLVLALVLNNPVADLIIGNYVNTSIPKQITKNSNGDVPDNITSEIDVNFTGEEQNSYAIQSRSMKAKQSVIDNKTKVLTKKLNQDNPVSKTFEVSVSESNEGLSFDGQQLIEAQRVDQSLDRIKTFICDEPQDTQSYFTVDDGLIYRVFNVPGKDPIRQIIVPKPLRSQILSLGHNVPLAGHILGTKKLGVEFCNIFFWPGLFTDVANYCRSCLVCQKKTPKGRVPKAALVSIPPLEEPFQRIALDFVGPLPLSERKNRFILVCVDYATKYPEAIPLRDQEAETVANALIELFSRVGIPKEILADQGSNFMSGIMKEVCRLLNIRKMRTSPYHAMCNGLCEKFNGVLKNMLKAYALSEPSEWDKYIPYVLFAYREVPHESTGFSPFELLYGRQIRGALAILKEEWEEPTDVSHSVLSYILETREKLKQMSELALMYETKAKQRQNFYYDKRARSRTFEVGQSVLVLLPTSTSKLLANWKGPYKIIEKVSPVNYKIRMRGKEKVFHINMLKLWYDRPAAGVCVETGITACLYSCAGISSDSESIDDMDIQVTPVLQKTERIKEVSFSF